MEITRCTKCHFSKWRNHACKFCEVPNSERERTLREVKDRIRRDFVDEYDFDESRRIALLISFGATPTSVREILQTSCYKRACEIKRRFKYFMKKNGYIEP